MRAHSSQKPSDSTVCFCKLTLQLLKSTISQSLQPSLRSAENRPSAPPLSVVSLTSCGRSAEKRPPLSRPLLSVRYFQSSATFSCPLLSVVCYFQSSASFSCQFLIVPQVDAVADVAAAAGADAAEAGTTAETEDGTEDTFSTTTVYPDHAHEAGRAKASSLDKQ